MNAKITEHWTPAEMQTKMNLIHNMDCLEFMKKAPDDYFDLVLTDPPYGIGADKNAHKNGVNCKANGFREYKNTNWDEYKPSKEVFDEIIRVSKNQIIWGANHFISKIPYDGACWLFWDKGQRDFSFADGEMAWTSLKYAVRAYTHSRGSFLKESGLHPTQKPLKVIRWCLEVSRVKNSHKVFDPFMGSGTTAIACKSLGLDWCGCELEADYVEIANKRLEQVQGSLF